VTACSAPLRIALAPALIIELKGWPAGAVTRAALEARGRKLRYFRHPFLHAGQTIETKRRLEQWLGAHGYTVAPVTLDNSDFIFASVYADRKKADGILAEYIAYMQSIVDFFDRRAVEVLGRRLPQILLIHASELNRDAMPVLLDMFRKSGYTFVSLEEALKEAHGKGTSYRDIHSGISYDDPRPPRRTAPGFWPDPLPSQGPVRHRARRG